MKKKILTLLALLMTAVTGAWAQEQSETIATTAKIVEGTHFTISNNNSNVDGGGMTADKGITVTPKNGETITKVVISCTFGANFVKDNNTSVSSGTKEITDGGGTISVTGVNASTFTFTCSNDFPQFGQFVVYYTEAPEAPASYSVSMKKSTEDATSWQGKAGEGEYQALPLEGVEAGTAVSVKYSGTKHVKSVKAVKKEPWDGNLSTLAEDVTVTDGMTLTGTLDGSTQKYKITIAAGATVTLDNATINGVHDGRDKNMWAGINCLGNATIILKDGTTNSVKGFNEDYPGIHVPEGSTLTIKGTTGSLTASSNGYGTGIGGGRRVNCGSIDIQGGVITANGSGQPGIGGGENATCGNITISGGTVTATCVGSYAAGIGSGYTSICGNITISGGTVTATGGMRAAGIGSGFYGASCGDITITSGVTSVTATKGMDAPNSIGAGDSSSCGTVTIEDGANVTQQ